MASQTTSIRPSRRSSSKTPSKTTASKPTTPPRLSPSPIDPDRRRALIAEAAYYHAEHRGFRPGNEESDWLAAETEVDTMLTRGVSIHSD